jgi:Protein of unknown function (DUF1559)
MITFACSHCGRKLGVPDDRAGRKVRCPACNEATLATGSAVAVSEKTSPERIAPPATEASRSAPAGDQATLPSGSGVDAGERTDDLSHWHDGEPGKACHQTRGERVRCWLRKRKQIAYLAAGALAAILAVVLVLALKSGAEADNHRAGPPSTAQPPLDEGAGPEAVSPAEAARRMSSQNNLKRLGIAFHSISDLHGFMPPAAICDRQTGKALLSWRVAVLLWVEQRDLYLRFRLDEPWDSPHNKPLLQDMPKIFEIDGTDAPKGHTCYQVFSGPGTPFDLVHAKPGDFFFARLGPIPRRTFPDGLSNTILIAEAGQAVPWTKPADLEVAPGKPLPALGGAFKAGFNVCMADGSVTFVSRTVSEETLRRVINPSDGLELGSDWPNRVGKDTSRTVFVKGKVTLRGKPVSGALMSFGDGKRTVSTAETGTDGSYGTWIPSGQTYKVLVQGTFQDEVPPRYRRPATTPLSFTVPHQPFYQTVNFELK